LQTFSRGPPYLDRPQPVLRVQSDGSGAELEFDQPVTAVSPGQAAVFYDAERGQEVLGGGWLARSAA